ARRFSRRARDERGRSARRILRPLVLRGLFHRPRRHEARGHGVQAAAEETAGSEEKEIALTRSGCAAPCKEQAGNREPSSAPLFYTRRLVLRSDQARASCCWLRLAKMHALHCPHAEEHRLSASTRI